MTRDREVKIKKNSRESRLSQGTVTPFLPITSLATPKVCHLKEIHKIMFFPHSARAMISYSSLTFVSLYRIVHVKRAHLGFVQLCLNLTATIPRHQNYWVDSKAIGRWLASRLNNLTSEAWTWRAWRDVNRLLHLRFTSIRSTKDESCIHNGKSEKKFGQEIHLLKFTKTRECQRVSLTQKSFPPSPNLGRVSALEVGWKFSSQCLSETESRSRDE